MNKKSGHKNHYEIAYAYIMNAENYICFTDHSRQNNEKKVFGQVFIH